MHSCAELHANKRLTALHMKAPCIDKHSGEIYTKTAFVKCMHYFNRKTDANALTAPAGSQAHPSATTESKPRAAESAWPPSGPTPRTADGKPNLSGAWAPNAIRQNVDLMATGVQVPFQPWAEKVYQQCRA